MGGEAFRLFVTGTDTGVGKTEAACALLSLLADAGLRPAAMKPYESGCLDWRRPADALALKAAARCDDPLDRVCLYRYRAPLAPGVAAARRRETPSFARVLALACSFRGRPLVIEGAGGLFVPIDAQRDVIDLIEALNIGPPGGARRTLDTEPYRPLAGSARQAPHPGPCSPLDEGCESERSVRAGQCGMAQAAARGAGARSGPLCAESRPPVGRLSAGAISHTEAEGVRNRLRWGQTRVRRGLTPYRRENGSCPPRFPETHD